jgi:HEAT repeat protein
MLARPSRWMDRDLVVAIVLDRLPRVDGGSRVRLLGWLSSQALVSRWIEDLSSRSAWTRGNAAERLAIVQAPESTEALVRVLDDPYFDVRMRAAKALGALGGQRARQALVGALSDENRWSVIRIADLLAEMGAEVVEELIEAFPRMARTSRLAALDLIAHVADGRTVPFLLRQLDDLDRDVRARAASALGRIGDETVVRPLTAALQDVEWPVRAMAAKAIGELRGLGAAQSLGASLRDREWWVRANAAEALQKLGPPGLDQLAAMLDDQDRFARDQALSMLESSGELARRLAPLGSPGAAQRQDALRLLDTLVSRQSRGRIVSLRDRQPDLRVREAIDEALSALEPDHGDTP